MDEDQWMVVPRNQIGNFDRNRQICIKLIGTPNVNYTLPWAIRNANLESIKYVIEKGEDVNKREVEGATPLLLATHLNRFNFVEYLIQKGALVNTPDSYETSLMVAVRKKYLDIVKLLIDNGADINLVNIEGTSPLFWAIKNNELEILKLLLVKGIPDKVVDSHGNSPLMVAVEHNNKAIIKYLLKAGAEINEAPLIWAAQKGLLDIIKILMSSGANINMVGFDGNTALATAVRHQKTEVAKFLITQNASVCKVGADGKTPLLWAVLNQDIYMVEWLLNHGSEYIIDSVVVDAIKTKNLDIVKILYNKGANYSERAFKTALNVESVEIAEYLLENGAQVVDDLQNEITYITKFLDNKNYGMVRLLVENGARLSSFDEKGETVLTKSVRLEDFDMVHYFVNRGVDVNQANNSNMTPLALAAKNNDFRTFQYLVDCGATIEDLSNVDAEVSRCYQIARDNYLKRRQALEFSSNQEDADPYKSEEFVDATDDEMSAKLTFAQKGYYVIEFD